MNDKSRAILKKYFPVVTTEEDLYVADNILGQGWGMAASAVAHIARASSGVEGEKLRQAFSDLGEVLLASDFGKDSSAAELSQAIAQNTIEFCGISASPLPILHAYEGNFGASAFESDETALGRVAVEAFETYSATLG